MQIPSEKAGSWPRTRVAPHVLVIDDEAVIRTALSRYFVRLGWTVRTAPSGRAALEFLGDRSVDFDLVICDLRMPSGSGEEVYRWLAENRPSLATRMVFLSGDTLAEETAAFLEQAGRPVLAKPFDLCELAYVAEQVRASVASERPLSFRTESHSGTGARLRADEESRASRSRGVIR